MFQGKAKELDEKAISPEKYAVSGKRKPNEHPLAPAEALPGQNLSPISGQVQEEAPNGPGKVHDLSPCGSMLMMWHAHAPGRQQDLRCGRVGIAFRFSDVMQLELCSPLVFEHVIVMLQNFKLR